MKKAQGLPINTIIIAALALIVLVILIGIVATNTSKFGRGISNATTGEICSNICSVSKCDNAMVGNFVGSDGKTKLSFSQVCCETACNP